MLKRNDHLAFMLLFLAAFVVRVIGVDYGYFNGDERINDAAKVLGGELIPGQHFYPPLFNYLNAVGFAGLFGVGALVGWWADTASFRAQYFVDPTAFYVTARVMTAATGAFLAPLGAMVARRVGVSLGGAVIVGLLLAVAPITVYFSYIAKSDIPLTSATVLVVLLFLKRVMINGRAPASADLALGVATVLALSFKQTVIFFLAPLLVAHFALLVRQPGYWRSLGLSLLAIIFLWPILNIGIVMDLGNFIAFQKIQAVISVQEDTSLWAGLHLWLSRATHLQWGIGWVTTVAFFGVPLWLRSSRCALSARAGLMALWWVTLVGMILLVVVARERQPEHFWLCFFAIMQLLAVLMLVDMACQGLRVASAALAVAGAMAGYGLILLWGQTLAVPTRVEISALIATHYADRKIMRGVALDVPQSAQAQHQEFTRLDRLAEKYDVQMPARAPERTITTNAPDAVFHIPMPGVMFGLEDATEEELKGKIKPYAWPLQAQEWELDYWTNQGFDVIVVSDLNYLMNDTPSQVFRQFYRHLANTCHPAHIIPPRKPLFLEREVIIFDCAVQTGETG